MIEIKIPKLGHGSVEAKIVYWHKKAGDRVRAGESVVEIMTEKVNFEIEAPSDGVITEILVPADEFAAEDAVVARIQGTSSLDKGNSQ
ncbi:MAG: lipoyl domain-containing protein [Acidobacteriia bacterium]|nr:lipoyl domain-containing protein [Terriglobia bacterium]